MFVHGGTIMKLPAFLEISREKSKLKDYVYENGIDKRGEKILKAYLFDRPAYNRLYEEAKDIGTDELVEHVVQRYLEFRDKGKSLYSSKESIKEEDDILDFVKQFD